MFSICLPYFIRIKEETYEYSENNMVTTDTWINGLLTNREMHYTGHPQTN